MTSNINDGSLRKEHKAGEGSRNNSMTSNKQVSPEDLQALKTMVRDFFHSPDQHSPFYIKDYPSTEKIHSSSQYDCYNDKDIPTLVLNQQVYCQDCSLVPQTSSSINKKLRRRNIHTSPMSPEGPPSPKGRKTVSTEIISKLPPPPFKY